jgi:transcriptional regulator with XRE-family HTH domain
VTDSQTDSLSRRLKLVRGSRSQREFADSLGVSLTAYQHYEAGRRTPDVDALRAIATEGWSVDWLVTGMGSGMKRSFPLPPAASIGRAEESTPEYAPRSAIDAPTWERAMRIVQLAADLIDPKPRAETFANAVADIYNTIAGRPQDNEQLAELVRRASQQIQGG